MNTTQLCHFTRVALLERDLQQVLLMAHPSAAGARDRQWLGRAESASHRTPIEGVDRSHDVVSGLADLELLSQLPKVPLFAGCTDAAPESDRFFDASWWISRTSGMIQLNPLVPLDLLYEDSHNSGGVGRVWAEHHKALADFVCATDPRSVFEIGGGHGMLAEAVGQTRAIPWTILEPNPSPRSECPAQYVQGFFDDRFKFEGNFDTVVHSHLFEHIYSPNQFMECLAQFMNPGKKLVFSVPNQDQWLRRGHSNCLGLEHTIFLTEPYIEFFLSRWGFELTERSYFRDDHSIFYAARRRENVIPRAISRTLYDEHRALYLDYLETKQKLIASLNTQMRAHDGHVFCFGAHVFSQELLCGGLDATRIEALLDNDPQKQSRRLYGTNLLVRFPHCLNGFDSPGVLLKAGAYTEEIREDILTNINPTTVFFE